MEPFVDKEEDFILSFLKKPRECYATCFRQSLEDTLNLLNPDGNLLVVLQKVRVVTCVNVRIHITY